jgi:hypothetical protein
MIRAGYLWGALAALLVCSGCSTIGDMRADERVFHSLNALDAAQSVSAISYGCYREVDPLMSSWAGEKPAAGEFVAWLALGSVALHAYNRYAEANDISDNVRTFVNVTAIAVKGAVVVRNHRIGMRPFGSGQGCAP